MTRSSLWRSFESDDAFLLKVLRFIILVTGIILLGFTGVLELTWPQQLVLGLLTVLLAIWMDRSSRILPRNADADACVGIHDVSLRVLENRDHDEVLFRSRFDLELARRLLHVPAPDRRDIFVRHSVFRLHANDMAAAPHSGRSWEMAIGRSSDPYNEPLNVVKYTALAAMNIDCWWVPRRQQLVQLQHGLRRVFLPLPLQCAVSNGERPNGFRPNQRLPPLRVP
jgi:cellulose synthase (UDP-forming)